MKRSHAALELAHRSNLKCASITTSNGHNLRWVNEVRYLGTYIISHL